jgi:fatty acid desaturase
VLGPAPLDRAPANPRREGAGNDVQGRGDAIAAPVAISGRSAGGGRGSDYAELSRQVRAAGLLDRRTGFYRARIALNLGLFALGWTVFALLGPSWWQLVVAAFLAVVFVQVGFLGHDAGHRQVFGSGRHNDLLGMLCADLLIGLSYSGWIDKHNRHHAHPNDVDRDPDIDGGGVVFTAAQARARRSGFGRWLARDQAALFFPMLLLEGLALHVASVGALRARPADRTRRIESVLLGVHVGGYLAAVFLVLPPAQAR